MSSRRRELALALCFSFCLASFASCKPGVEGLESSGENSDESSADKIEVPKLSADATEDEVHEALRALNPRYRDDAQFQVKSGQIVALSLEKTQVKDISCLRGLKLLMLILSDTSITDISVLEGMPLETLVAQRAPIRDLSPLSGVKTLQALDLMQTKVADLGPLRGLPL